MRNKRVSIERFFNHISSTLLNKLAAIALVSCGALIRYLDGDSSYFIAAIIIGTPMFLASKNLFGRKD